MYKIYEPKKIGALIKAKRTGAKESRGELAEKMHRWDNTPVTVHMVKHWEEGRAEIRFYFLVQICNIYELSINTFL